MPSKRRGDKQRGEKVGRAYPSSSQLSDWLTRTQFLEGSMTLKPIVHEIRIQNQVIFLDPPTEYARQTWLQQLHDWLGEYRPGHTSACQISLMSF